MSDNVNEKIMDNSTKKSREKSVRYPYYSLKDCIDYLSIIHEIGGKKEAPIESVLSKFNIESKNNRRLVYLTSSSEIFGLITKTNLGLKPTDIGTLILYPPHGDEQRRQLLIEAFQLPQIYQKIIERYDQTILPNRDILKNIFYSLGIARTVLDNAVDSFIESAQYANVLSDNRLLVNVSEEIKLPSSNGEERQSSEPSLHSSKKPDPIPQELEDYYKLELPTSSGKRAVIQLPKECNKQDLEKLKKLLEAICGD